MAEIEQEITALENGKNTTYPICERLSVLYNVRDHLKPAAKAYSSASEPASEFVELATSIDLSKLITVLDEHLSAVKLLYPKEYTAVLRKLRE